MYRFRGRHCGQPYMAYHAHTDMYTRLAAESRRVGVDENAGDLEEGRNRTLLVLHAGEIRDADDREKDAEAEFLQAKTEWLERSGDHGKGCWV